MNSKVENTIELVKNSPASLFTKEDVIKLLNDVSDVPAGDEDTPKFSEEQLDELIDQVREDIVMNYDIDNLVDFEDAEFTLNGNTIELQHVDVNLTPLQAIAEDAIRNWFDNNIIK